MCWGLLCVARKASIRTSKWAGGAHASNEFALPDIQVGQAATPSHQGASLWFRLYGLIGFM